jgi:hypothetical protein
MGIKEVIEEITSKHKFYIGVMSQPAAAMFLKRFREGTARHQTVLKFIGSFGYELDVPATYKKTIK